MATEVSPVDRIQEAIDQLEARKTLITNCTALWNSLSNHFSTLEQTLAARSQSVDSKLQALDSHTDRDLEALALREAGIPEREASSAAAIESRRAAVLAEIADPVAVSLEESDGGLRWYCRRMEAARLWRRLTELPRRDFASLRRELADAVAEAVDPARLVLDAVEDFMTAQQQQAAGGDRCWPIGMLLRVMCDLEEKAREVSVSIRERAAVLAETWKEKAEMGGSEALMLLQMVVAFGLQSKFEQESLRKLVFEHASRKEMPKLATGLGFGEKLADVIDDLRKTKKELEAVHFAMESNLTEQFPPASLLESYIERVRKDASAILKKGNYSYAAVKESNALELNALRSIIKFVESNKLEPKYNLDALRKRMTQLEKAKTVKKKTPVVNKLQIKRARSGGAASSFRRFKAAKTRNTSFPSSHRNPRQ